MAVHNSSSSPHLKIKITAAIFVPHDQIDNQGEWAEDLKKFCQQQLNFFNPKIIELQRLGFSTWGTPKYINCFKDLKSGWLIPTGFFDTFKEYCLNHNIKLTIADQRITQPITNIQCQIKPRSEQQQVLDQLLLHQRAILEAKPGFGKTMAALLYFAARGQKTLVIVHTRSLLQQWRQRIKDYFTITPEQLGIIGEGKWQIGSQITIASYQTLLSRGTKSIEKEFGLIIIDECHHVPAQTFTKVARSFYAKYYLGLSATPFRKDKLDKLMTFYIGDIIQSPEANHVSAPGKNLSSSAIMGAAALPGISHPASTTQHSTILPADKTHLVMRSTKFYVENPDLIEFVQLGSLLIEDIGRNELILRDILAAIKKQGKCLILSERVAHCEFFYRELQNRLPDLKVGLITGQIKKADREQIFTEVRSNHYQVLVATGSVIGEGFDWPSIDHLFLTYPFSWRGKLIQYAGRAQRLAPGKKEAFIYDYIDGFVPMLKAMYRRRARAYQELGIRPLPQ